jgi:transcriptional regulator with XRE-family HTH domain
MDFRDPKDRKFAAKAVGEVLRQTREARGWSRLELVANLPSGIGDRTLLSYEHGSRAITVLRFLELCQSLQVEAPSLLSRGLQRAQILLEHVVLDVDLLALLRDQSPQFRPMHQWARNKLNRHHDGIATVAPGMVLELADFTGCRTEDLAAYLARFAPDLERSFL